MQNFICCSEEVKLGTSVLEVGMPKKPRGVRSGRTEDASG